MRTKKRASITTDLIEHQQRLIIASLQSEVLRFMANEPAKKRKPLFKVLNTLICNDVRREDNGKLFLIGIYNNAILLPEGTKLPQKIPQLTIWFQVMFYEPKIEDLCIELLGPNGKSIMQSRGEMTTEGSEDPIVFNIDLCPFTIKEWGTYTIRFGVGRPRKVASFVVREGNFQTTALPQ